MEGGYLIEGGCVLSSPGGNQEYLSFIIPLIHRVLNKVAIEKSFPCIPPIKKRWGLGGEGGGTYSRGCLVNILA